MAIRNLRPVLERFPRLRGLAYGVALDYAFHQCRLVPNQSHRDPKHAALRVR